MVQVTSSPVDDGPPDRFPNPEPAPPPPLDLSDRGKNRAESTVPVEIDDPRKALQIFEAAVTARNRALAKQVVDILHKMLDRSNALMVLLRLNRLRNGSEPNNFAPSAPPLMDSLDDQREDWVEDLVNSLRSACLREMCKNGDTVLKQKEILELLYKDILELTTNQYLQVSKEATVYSTIMRWSIEECIRRMLDPDISNLRKVVGDLRYAPRYGLMSKEEFACRSIDGVRGPSIGGILTKEEVELFQNYIKKRTKGSYVDELPHNCSKKRLSLRSASLTGSVDEKKRCDKFILNVLSCWTAFFD